MKDTFAVTGKLKSANLEFRGDSNFPVLKVEISTGEKWLGLEAIGQDAHRLNTIVGEMPAGAAVEAIARFDMRISNAGKPYTVLQLISLAPSFSGTQGTVASLMGRIAGVEEVPMRNGGSFEKPILELVGADRQGPLTGELSVNFTYDKQDAAMAEWKANKGALVEITGEVSAYITDDGRSFPRLYVKSMTVHPMPSYMKPFFEGDGQEVAEVLEASANANNSTAAI